MLLSDVDGSIILTSNSRLARWVLYKYGEEKKSLGYLTWPTPTILSLNAWMTQVWKASWQNRFILSELQSLQVWKSIIQEDSVDLLDFDEASKQAAQAYKLINEYAISLESKYFEWTIESKSFYRWALKYQRNLNSWNALDQSSLIDEIYKGMLSGIIALPAKRIILAGYEYITKQLKNWTDFLLNQNIIVDSWPKETTYPKASFAPTTKVRSYYDLDDEIIQCARWVRNTYRPKKTIGIIVFDLYKKRNKLIREFSTELLPDSILPWLNRELPFTISRNSNFINEPAIELALMMISTSSSFVPMQLFCHVLKSPFLLK